MKKVISQSLGLDLVNINVYWKVYQNIPLSSRDRAIFTFFRIWTSATPRPIPNDISQSLGLHLVNINAYAKFYQNIPNGLRVSCINIFQHFSQTGRGQNLHKLSGDKIKCLIIGHSMKFNFKFQLTFVGLCNILIELPKQIVLPKTAYKFQLVAQLCQLKV